MTCRNVVEGVAEYLADELDARTRCRLDRHLARCAECVAYARTYRDAIRFARAAYAEPETDVP